jgi:hypothetical protein
MFSGNYSSYSNFLKKNSQTDSLSKNSKGKENEFVSDSISISQKGTNYITYNAKELLATETVNLDVSLKLFSGNGDNGDSFVSFGRLLGLKGTTNDKVAFLQSLDDAIAKESDELTRIFNSLFKETGLGEETKKITFAENRNGNIVVNGNINARKKKQLANRINEDIELVERIKNQKAKMQIAEELKKKQNADLSSESLAPARKQLLNDFLNKNGGFLLDNISTTGDLKSEKVSFLYKDDASGNTETNQELYSLVTNLPGLKEELYSYLKEKTAQQSVSVSKSSKRWDSAMSETGGDERLLLAMKRGEIQEATDEIIDEERIRQFRSAVGGVIRRYNEQIVPHNYDSWIKDVTIRFDEYGNIKVDDIEFKETHPEEVDPEKKYQALEFLNKKFGEIKNAAQEVASILLGQHDDEHGDVEEYKHELVMSTGFSNEIEIRSPEADRVALKEIRLIGNEVGLALADYFGIKDVFNVTLDGNGLLSSIDCKILEGTNVKSIEGVINDLNKRLESDDPFDEEIFGTLPYKLEIVLEKLVEMKEARDKIHDPNLKKAEMTFVINPNI